VRGIRLSDRVIVAAPPGQGKTTLIEYIVWCLQPLRTVLIDPKEAPELRHIRPIVRDVELLPEALRGAVCHWIPHDVEDRDDLAAGFEAIWALHKHGPRVIWDDEAADTSKPGWIAPGAGKLIRRGRAWKQLYIAGTQRLAETAPVVRTQAEHIIALTPAPMDIDLDKLSQHIGINPRQLKEMLDELHEEAGAHSHLWHVQATRETRRMVACPPGPHWKTRRIQQAARAPDAEGQPAPTGAQEPSQPDREGLASGG